MKCLTQLKQHLCPGTAYRRAELAQWSKRVDQHIKVLIEEGVLTQLESDLYYCPKKSLFGMVPISATERVKQFLKDGDFLLTSPNAYNQLGVGTTQLYNITVVYNHKYQGTVDLDGRHFEFRRKNKFPKKLSNEFLLVDLMNNLKTLAEDHEAIREKVGEKALQFDQRKLKQAVKQYGSVTSQEYFGELFANANRRAD